jgi:predicted Zn finger-like uncharacterized protein
VDVQCERCKTEYEFDDALVSGRGTTVRCTQCGHQFKVRRGETETTTDAAQDRWIVTTTLGKQLTYLTLRELQRAIMAKQVGRSDTLARGTTPPRLLGSISELEPFFDGRTSNRPPAGSGSVASKLPAPPAMPSDAPRSPSSGDVVFPKRTPAWGVDAKNVTSVSTATPMPISVPPPTARYNDNPPPPSPSPAPRAKTSTLRPPSNDPFGAAAARTTSPGLNDPVLPEIGAPLSPQNAYAATVAASQPQSGHTAPLQALPHDVEPPTMPRPPQPSPELSSPLPPPTAPVRRMISSIDEDAMSDAMQRQMLHSASDPDSLGYGAPKRRRVGGWIVAVVLLGGVGVLGFIVAKPYLTGANKAAASAAPLDEKTQQFLVDGEKALADGNLDAAKENFDKASARAEKDPRVLLDLARLAASRADVPWLKTRILPPEATDEAKATKQSLGELAAVARKAADDAIEVSPEEPAALRAKIDASRIGGERDTARKLVAKVIAQAQQPETAYVLAALDLAEPEPIWTTVIERLRLAAQGEGSAGRARAALVYALARSGDKVGAKAELEKLASLARPHPLVATLRAFVDKAATKPIADGGAADSGVPLVAVSSLPNAPPGMTGELPPGTVVMSGSVGQAMQALAKGDKDRARQIYEGLVAKNPNDSEALTGLGDVARASGDTAGAIAAYKRALAVNPSYLHALIALADTYWASGNRGEAIRLYHDIMDRFPESAYPAYVKQRAEGGGPAPTASTPTTAPSATAPPPATTTTPPPAPPAPKAPTDGF